MNVPDQVVTVVLSAAAGVLAWEAAAAHLHNITGLDFQDDEGRPFFRDAVYVFLRAHQHLSRERVDEINRQLGEFRLRGRGIGSSGL